MSGLEIVASIAGVATAAIKISVSMNDVADELGSAGRVSKFHAISEKNCRRVKYLKTEEETVDLALPNSTAYAGLPFLFVRHGRQHAVQTVRQFCNYLLVLD